MIYPVVGGDSFRPATGVHAAAIAKAISRNDGWLADRVYCGVPATMVGRTQGIEVGPMSGEHNVRFWLRNHEMEENPVYVEKILVAAKRSNGHLQSAPGVLLVNDHEIIPGSVANAAEKYPHQAIEFLQAKGMRVIALRASQQAKELGDGRIANMVMLGALSALAPGVPAEVWQATLNERVPQKFLALNLKAFELGKDLIGRSEAPAR